MRPSPSSPLDLDPAILGVARFHAAALIRRNGVFAPCDRDDVAQDLVVSILERLPRHQAARAGPATFADRIARNRAADLARHRRRERHLFVSCEGAAGPSEQGAATVAVLPDAEGIARRVDLRRAVERLGEEDAALCRLVAETTITEAARELGVARSTVHRRLRRLRGPLAHLRDYVAGDEPALIHSHTDQEDDPWPAD